MFRTLFLFAALTLTALPALADDDKPKADRPRIKVFPLKNVAPGDAVQAFNALNGHDTRDLTPGITPGTFNGPPMGLQPLLPPLPSGPTSGTSFEVGEQPVAF